MSERWVPLDVVDCDPDPFVQFQRWFDDARDVLREREAIVLATASLDALPSARMVLLRSIENGGFGWFTNYDSRKGTELRENPHAALLWYCEPLGRQIRIEGDVTMMSDEESDAYFASRPRGHQIGAHASHQSQELASREELETRVRELEASFEGHDIARPPYWGGFRLTPSVFEFWQHRRDRLHDRVLYHPSPDGWHRSRQSP